jgi:ketosteroid isomerase-like protein
MTKKALAALVPALLLTAAVRADDSEVKAVEKAITALNQAFEKGDVKKVRALMTDDHIAVTPSYGGPLAREEQLKGLADLKLAEYRAGKMKVRLLGRDAALVTYELSMKGTYRGKPVPPRCYASAVWARQGGKWLEAFYQETALGRK